MKKFNSIQLFEVTTDKSSANVADEDLWIFGANSLHLATKFYPKGLYILLSSAKNRDALISRTHQKKRITPLHLAAAQQDSLSTRYEIFIFSKHVEHWN